MDTAASLRRAALQGHERKLERAAWYGRLRRFKGAVGYHRPQFRQIEEQHERVAVVFGLRVRTGDLWDRQHSSALRHYESERRQWRRESLRIAVQLPRRIR